MTNGFTKTEQAILQLLSDGQPHYRNEVLASLGDPMATLKVMQVHIGNIRRKLLLRGETILCESVRRQTHYRHVRLLANPYT